MLGQELLQTTSNLRIAYLEQLYITENTDKENYVYCGYRILFDSAGSWSFGYVLAGNVLNFGVYNLFITVHADSRKNKFLVLGQGLAYRINGSFGSPEKEISISFSKANPKFCLSLHYNADNSYLFGNGKESFKFTADNKNVNLPTQFFLRSISNGFSSTESREVNL